VRPRSSASERLHELTWHRELRNSRRVTKEAQGNRDPPASSSTVDTTAVPVASLWPTGKQLDIIKPTARAPTRTLAAAQRPVLVPLFDPRQIRGTGNLRHQSLNANNPGERLWPAQRRRVERSRDRAGTADRWRAFRLVTALGRAGIPGVVSAATEQRRHRAATADSAGAIVLERRPGAWWSRGISSHARRR